MTFQKIAYQNSKHGSFLTIQDQPVYRIFVKEFVERNLKFLTILWKQ